MRYWVSSHLVALQLGATVCYEFWAAGQEQGLALLQTILGIGCGAGRWG